MIFEKRQIQFNNNSIKAPIIFVLRKNNKLKLYIDYQRLNKIIKKNRTILPLINKIFNRLLQIRFFIKIDLKEIYYSIIKIKKENKQKITFQYKYNHFEYIVLLLGLINISTIFYIVINKNLKSFIDQIYIMFLNDIFIYFNIFEEYKKYIKNVLKRFNQYNFFVNLDKCKFYI